MKRFAIVLIMLSWVPQLMSQQLTSYNLQHLPQRNSMNPAFAPHGKMYVGIPVFSGVSESYSNNGFCYNHLFRKNSNNALILDIENAISMMNERNQLLMHSEIELLGFGVRFGKSYFSLNATEKIDLSFAYSRAFMEFMFYGNAASAGTVQQLSPDLESVHYREYGLTWSGNLTSYLTAGIRAKYLYGMEHAMTNGQGISVYTDPLDFDITATSDYTIYTSGVDTGSFSDFSFSEYATGKNNHGYGFDAGITIFPLSSLEISASVTDIGSIKWATETAIHHTATGSDNFIFTGINLNEFIHNDSLDAETYIEQIGDSLYESFNVTTTRESYSYTLPRQIFFSTSYMLTDQFRISGLVKNKHYDQNSKTDFQLSFTGKTRHWLNYTFALNKINDTPVSLGAGFALNYRNSQLYFSSDNVPGLISWKKSYNTGFRAGLNLMFGVRPKSQPPPQPEFQEPQASTK